MKGLDDHLDNYGNPANGGEYLDDFDQAAHEWSAAFVDIDDEYDGGEMIPDDHPIWTERDRIMFPDTAGFFADQITESASAMRPVPTLCHAVCPTHHWSCAAELPHGDGAHVCNSGGQPHHFFTRKQ